MALVACRYYFHDADSADADFLAFDFLAFFSFAPAFIL